MKIPAVACTKNRINDKVCAPPKPGELIQKLGGTWDTAWLKRQVTAKIHKITTEYEVI